MSGRATMEISRDSAAGVYMLWRDGAVMYVGQTANIFNRIGQHWGKDWDLLTFEVEPHSGHRMSLEEQRIAEHLPPWNVHGNPMADKRMRPHGLRGKRVCA